MEIDFSKVVGTMNHSSSLIAAFSFFLSFFQFKSSSWKYCMLRVVDLQILSRLWQLC